MDLVRKAFYWFFPAIPKKTFNVEGKNLQDIMMIQTFLHFALFVLNLIFVGFYPMLMELGFMILSFTVYLNLREYTIVIYILSLIAGGIYKF